MASTSPTEIALLRDLVAIPSISGEELPAAECVEATARRLGLDVVRDETSVRVEVGDVTAGPTLAFATHLDVVPPGDGWTRDPFTPVIEGDLLYGRGSGDAKASVAAISSSSICAHTLRATYTRDAAEHFWPWNSKAPRTIAVATACGSADGWATMKSLPPVSPTRRGKLL